MWHNFKKLLLFNSFWSRPSLFVNVHVSNIKKTGDVNLVVNQTDVSPSYIVHTCYFDLNNSDYSKFE